MNVLYGPFEGEHRHQPGLSSARDGVAVGFPSPADDHLQQGLNLNKYLVPHPVATFLMWLEEDFPPVFYKGDLLIVDRSLSPRHQSHVVSVVDGTLTLCKVVKNRLVGLDHVRLGSDSEVQLWGVVTHSIRHFTKAGSESGSTR